MELHDKTPKASKSVLEFILLHNVAEAGMPVLETSMP